MNSQVFHNFFLENCTSVNNNFSILFLLGAPKIINSVLLSFTFNPFFLKKRMSLAILFSRCNFDSEIVFPLQKTKVSSAYWILLEFTSVSSFISFTYMLKSSGPSTVPCGTPRLSTIQFDSYFENLPFCTRFSRQDFRIVFACSL